MSLWIAVAGMLATFALGWYIGFVKGWNALWWKVRSRVAQDEVEREWDARMATLDRERLETRVRQAYLRGQADAQREAKADKIEFHWEGK